jgi:hypothetical protein
MSRSKYACTSSVVDTILHVVSTEIPTNYMLKDSLPLFSLCKCSIFLCNYLCSKMEVTIFIGKFERTKFCGLYDVFQKLRLASL